jgi:hypothetical protein
MIQITLLQLRSSKYNSIGGNLMILKIIEKHLNVDKSIINSCATIMFVVLSLPHYQTCK